MPHREYDIHTDLLTLLRKRRQLQFICTMCGYGHTWHGGELARLARALGNCKVCEFQKKAVCSCCGNRKPRVAIDFADGTTGWRVPRRVGTLGDLKRGQRYLSVHCERVRCGNSAKPDLDALIERLGEDYGLQRFLERCRCSRCNARYPEVSVQAPPLMEWGKALPICRSDAPSALPDATPGN